MIKESSTEQVYPHPSSRNLHKTVQALDFDSLQIKGLNKLHLEVSSAKSISEPFILLSKESLESPLNTRKDSNAMNMNSHAIGNFHEN